MIGNNIAHLFPSDFDTMILTGFSKSVLPSLIGVSLQAPIPAALENAQRFGGLAVGYVRPQIHLKNIILTNHSSLRPSSKPTQTLSSAPPYRRRSLPPRHSYSGRAKTSSPLANSSAPTLILPVHRNIREEF